MDSHAAIRLYLLCFIFQPSLQIPLPGESPGTTTEDGGLVTSTDDLGVTILPSGDLMEVFFDEGPSVTPSSSPQDNVEVSTEGNNERNDLEDSTTVQSEPKDLSSGNETSSDLQETTSDPVDIPLKFVDVPEDFSAVETSTAVEDDLEVTARPHPLQNDILDELNSLWVISEQLEPDYSELKASLTSLVHMTYARVYDFDEDSTLNKLKSLLRLLRSKLSPSHSIERRSLKEPFPSLKNLTTNPTNLTVHSLSTLRWKNNSRFALEDSGLQYEDVNSLFPSAAWDEADSLANEFQVTHVKNPIDKWESHETSTPLPPTSTSSSTSTSPSTSNSTAVLPLTVTTNALRPPALTVMSNKDFSTLPDAPPDFLKFNSSTISTQTESPLASTVDEILQSIIAILNEPQKVNQVNEAVPSNASQPNSSSLPSYLNSFLVGVPLISSVDLVDKVGTSSSSEVTLTSSDTSISPQKPLTPPPSMINSTMERIVMVVTIFSNLSSASRMTLTFALSIAALSLAIGYYIMGVPMIVVGVLAIVLTLFFVASFQNAVGKKKKRVDEAQDILIDEETISRILSFISDAVNLYKPPQEPQI